MEIAEEIRLNLVAQEGFIRRAAQFSFPFMLKGSFVTRQYFPEPSDRIPADLDWVYLLPLKNENMARQALDEWAIAVTEFELYDGVEYRSFQADRFWRSIDYAMADDFPTVNTDLICFVKGIEVEVSLDVSFNLNLEESPIPLIYQPLEGDEFMIPFTVPLSLQVSWKIHQTLVRPRFKDLFDLMYLVRHEEFNERVLAVTLQALANECHVDKVDPKKLHYFLNYELDRLFVRKPIEKNWEAWRNGSGWNWQRAEAIANIERIPAQLSTFLAEFQAILEGAGFDRSLLDRLPEPTVTRNTKIFFDPNAW